MPLVREYEVPYYRMRNLYRRLDSLIPHLANRNGLHLSYFSSSHTVCATQWRNGEYRMESVQIEDGIRDEGKFVVAAIDRRSRSLLPMGQDMVDDDGMRIPIIDCGHVRDEPLLAVDGVDWSEWLDAISGDAPECECCHREVGSKERTYLVSGGDGHIMQVCRRCLPDYAGGLPVRLAERYVDVIGRIVSYSTQDAISGVPGSGELFYADRIIAFALFQIDTTGYPEANVRAWDTTVRYREWLRGEMSSIKEETIAAVSAYLPEARDAWKWAKSGFHGTPHGKWMDKVTTIAKNSLDDRVEMRDYGLVSAIAIPWHGMRKGNAAITVSKWINPNGSQWIGSPGEQIRERIVKAYAIRRRRKQVKFLTLPVTTWLMVTDKGNIMMWMTTKKVEDTLESDCPKIVTGTVVQHSEYEYMGIKQTVVKRCQIAPDS